MVPRPHGRDSRNVRPARTVSTEFAPGATVVSTTPQVVARAPPRARTVTLVGGVIHPDKRRVSARAPASPGTSAQPDPRQTRTLSVVRSTSTVGPGLVTPPPCSSGITRRRRMPSRLSGRERASAQKATGAPEASATPVAAASTTTGWDLRAARRVLNVPLGGGDTQRARHQAPAKVNAKPGIGATRAARQRPRGTATPGAT